MRYSVAATALLVGAATASLQAGVSNGVVSQASDGQVQAPGPSAYAASSEVAEEHIVYQTIPVTITSCAPSVTSCPAKTSPYVTSTVIPASSTLDNSPVGETHPALPPAEAETHPVSPAETHPAPPAETHPAPPAETYPAPPADTTAAPEETSNVINSPVGDSSSCTCPPPVTVTATITLSPSGAPTGFPSATGDSPVGPANGAPGVEAPVETAPEDTDNSPVGPGSVASGAEVSAEELPSAVDNSPLDDASAVTGAGVAAPTGTAPVGTATGVVIPPTPTGPPITPFEGAASTLSGSFVAVGLTAIAAMFLA
ncbi:MAG: hypothetical protein Q9197_004754 [Variospora fuerteventurae]